MRSIYKSFLVIVTFLVVSGASLSNGFTATIEMPNNPRFSTEDYLTYFYSRIPVPQIRLSSDGNTVEITGEVQVDLSRLPDAKKAPVLAALQEWILNKRTWRGLAIDLSQANLSFNSNLTAIQQEGGAETFSSGFGLYRGRALRQATESSLDKIILDAPNDEALAESARADQFWKKSCEDYLGTPPIDKP